MTKKALIGIVILLLLFFGAGLLVGTKLKAKTSTLAPEDKENTYRAGWEAAKKQLAERGMSTPTGMEIKSVNGIIDTISGNSINLKNVATMDPLSDLALNNRTVQITSDTKIYQLTQKDPAQFQQEMSDFQKKIQEQTADGTQPSAPLNPPYPTDRKEIALTDLKSGQQVMVTSTENIGDKKEFSVKEIIVQPEMNVPTVPSSTNASAVPPVAPSSGSQTITAPPMPTGTPVAPSAPAPPIK